MGIEETLLLIQRSNFTKFAGYQSRHHFKQRSYMIFGFLNRLMTLDTQKRHIVAQPRQRFLMKKTGKIIRSIGQQLTAPDTDKEILIFLRDLFGRRLARDVREGANNLAEFRVVTGHSRGDVELIVTGRAGKQVTDKPVHVRTKRILFGELY